MAKTSKRDSIGSSLSWRSRKLNENCTNTLHDHFNNKHPVLTCPIFRNRVARQPQLERTLFHTIPDFLGPPIHSFIHRTLKKREMRERRR